MQVFVNNKEVLTDSPTLSALLSELGQPVQGIAVAIGQKLVPRSEWEATALSAGTHITIVRAVCGG